MEDRDEKQNRRKSERIDVAFTLIYSVEKPFSLYISLGLNDKIDALMINLSDSGMAIITKYHLPSDTELRIKFNIIDLRLTGDDRWKKMEITGKVTSNITLPNENFKTNHRIGIRFINILDKDKIEISNFVKRNMLPSQ